MTNNLIKIETTCKTCVQKKSIDLVYLAQSWRLINDSIVIKFLHGHGQAKKSGIPFKNTNFF